MQWWQEPVRIIQYNLQVHDTERMDPQEIAGKARAAGANAIVVNAGGIYAWYESKIPFHHRNEKLSRNPQILERLIACCHQMGVKVIGRFDFSKTDDIVSLHHPEWFVQTREGKPVCYGKERMGSWSLLFSTCINGGYRNDEFAVPVLEEALEQLELDGIFFNAPHMEKCWCENCRRKYRRMYGRALPTESDEWESDWASRCLRDNMKLLYGRVKEKKPELPVILYYGTYREDGGGTAENLDLRYETADLICTEAQDILSAGKKTLPDSWKPSLNMKLGQSVPNRPRPFGIIHSCPGMDWRHTGMPAAEYEFWLSQIPAANGQLWHSLTGFDAVITDKRLLAVMERVTRKASYADEMMRDAVSAADVLLLWAVHRTELDMVEGLMDGRIAFDVMDCWHFDAARLRQYRTVLLPGGFPMTQEIAEALRGYVEEGGCLYTELSADVAAEGNLPKSVASLLGVAEEICLGRSLTAAYGVLEEAGERLRGGLEETVYLPVRGDVLYVRPLEHTQTLMTLVPPFAPPDGVGAPPERAQLTAERTQLPLLLEHSMGRGRVVSAFFGLSGLVRSHGLGDQKQLFENCIASLGGRYLFDGSMLPDGVFAYPYRVGDKLLVHLVNGIGTRPLRSTVVCRNVTFSVRRWKQKLSGVKAVLDQQPVWQQTMDDRIEVHLDSLAVWELLVLE